MSKNSKEEGEANPLTLTEFEESSAELTDVALPTKLEEDTVPFAIPTATLTPRHGPIHQNEGGEATPLVRPSPMKADQT